MSENTPRGDDPHTEQTEVVPPPPPPEPTDPAPPESMPEPEDPGAAPPPPGGAGGFPPPPGEVTGQPYPPGAGAQPPAQQPWSQPYGGPVPAATSMSPQDEKTWGLASHGVALAATILSGGFLSFVAAVVMYVVFKDRGPFVRAHAANALNVQIIASIVFLVSLPLMFVLIGFATFGIAWVLAVIAHIVGMVKANNGEWWDPPLTPKFVR